MRAMVLHVPGQPLRLEERPVPEPGPEQLLLKVHACAVCRTDLHVADGELTRPKLPLVLGHEIVGTVVKAGERARILVPGTRVGVPWLGWSDGTCRYCLTGRENLCDNARFTGYQLDGGYADYTVADHRFCFPIPAGYEPSQAAPLLCAVVAIAFFPQRAGAGLALLGALFAGYIAAIALPPGGHYLSVFRFVGTSAFMAFSLGLLHDSIWYARQWSTTLKLMLDGLIYSLVLAGTFGWLWPKAM